VLLPWAVEQVDLIGPSGDTLTAAMEESYSMYTTRVRLHIVHERAEAAPWTEVDWRGFNAGVLRMSALCNLDGIPAPLGMLTPLQATVRIEYTEPPRAIVKRSSNPASAQSGRADNFAPHPPPAGPSQGASVP